MRILAANKMDWEHPRAGGAEVNLRETLSRLSKRGHEVHLITSMYPGADRHEELEGVEVHRYGFGNRTNEIFILTAGQLYLNYLIRKLDPDVVYTVNSIIGWLPVTRIPHVTAIHHIYGKSIFKQLDFPFDVLGYLAESGSIYLSRGRKTISVSPSTTKNLVNRGFDDEDIVEIINGIDTDCYSSGKESEDPRILYLGRLEHNKGVDKLPGIYDYLEEELEDFTLDIAGFGRKEQRAEELAEQKNEAVFHGYVDEEQKKELLQKAWVVITPSRLEGWGMAVSEANASGTPVVGFETKGLKDSIEDGENGYLVEFDESQDSVDRFSQKVEELVEQDKRREEMSLKAREIAESRNWKDSVDKLEDLFQEVTEG